MARCFWRRCNPIDDDRSKSWASAGRIVARRSHHISNGHRLSEQAASTAARVPDLSRQHRDIVSKIGSGQDGILEPKIPRRDMDGITRSFTLVKGRLLRNRTTRRQ